MTRNNNVGDVTDDKRVVISGLEKWCSSICRGMELLDLATAAGTTRSESKESCHSRHPGCLASSVPHSRDIATSQMRK